MKGWDLPVIETTQSPRHLSDLSEMTAATFIMVFLLQSSYLPIILCLHFILDSHKQYKPDAAQLATWLAEAVEGYSRFFEKISNRTQEEQMSEWNSWEISHGYYLAA